MEVGVMPKEQVIGEAGEQFEVVVGWGPGTVQVGVESSDGRAIVSVLYGDTPSLVKIAQQVSALFGVPAPTGQTSDEETERQAALGRRLLDIVEGNPNDPELSYTGLHATLGRSSTNQLIRVERRARDIAFGKDE